MTCGFFLCCFLLECKLGWFGENCSRLCVGHCKDGATCNHVTGQCKEGCGTGWTGFICEIGKISTPYIF